MTAPLTAMAFPSEQHETLDGSWNQTFDPGMSLRDWFAGHVAGGMAAYSGTAGASFGPGDIAKRAYEIADAMLVEGSKQ